MIKKYDKKLIKEINENYKNLETCYNKLTTRCLINLIEYINKNDDVIVIDFDGFQCYFDIDETNRILFTNFDYNKEVITGYEIYKNEDGKISSFDIQIKDIKILCCIYKKYEIEMKGN